MVSRRRGVTSLSQRLGVHRMILHLLSQSAKLLQLARWHALLLGSRQLLPLLHERLVSSRLQRRQGVEQDVLKCSVSDR